MDDVAAARVRATEARVEQRHRQDAEAARTPILAGSPPEKAVSKDALHHPEALEDVMVRARE
jgi:hypothetical protein